MDPLAAQVQEASGRARDGIRADQHRRRVAQQAGPQPLAEARRGAALEGARQLPRREVQERDDRRQTRGDRDRVAGGVVDGPGRATTLRPPGRPDRRAAEHERVDRQRRLAQQPGRRQQAPADDLEALEAGRRVVLVRGEQEGERLARPRVGVEAAQQAIEVGGGPRRTGRFLERPDVHDDAYARRQVLGCRLSKGAVGLSARRPLGAPRFAGHFACRRRRTLPISSSARSCTTTTSASTMIRRDILLWPTVRSRNVIGTSRMRAPARLAR